MDDFLAVIGAQAMRYAIRSGIALTSRYAIGQCSRLLETISDKDMYTQLAQLQARLDSKIKVIAPTIDLVEFKSGRGNVFLDSALPLTQSLHGEIVILGRRVEAITLAQEEHDVAEIRLKQRRIEVRTVISDIQTLLDRLDREIPLLQLAISASGESLSSSLPTYISPSRLLQASTLLVVSDTLFSQNPSQHVEVGPVFSLSLYMLFLGHATAGAPAAKNTELSCDPSVSHNLPVEHEKRPYGLGEADRKPIWQEVVHKARVQLLRAPREVPQCATERQPEFEYSYYLDIIEDQNDGRVHDDECTSPGVSNAQIKEQVPIHQISKIFYTDSGRLLNLGNDSIDEKTPILLLKRDVAASRMSDMDAINAYGDCVDEPLAPKPDLQAEVDRQILEEDIKRETSPLPENSRETTAGRFPPHLDPEWIAMEIFEEDVGDETYASDDDREPTTPHSKTGPAAGSGSSHLEYEVNNFSLGSTSTINVAVHDHCAPTVKDDVDGQVVAPSPLGAITTSLSLIEMLIRLASLQEFQQASHLSIPDHILTFFLEETSTTGLMGEAQRMARREAEGRVGFDPYTDSPTH